MRMFAAFLLAVLAACAAPAFPAAAGEENSEDPPPLAADDIPVRLFSARVGEWASYVNADGHTLRLTVVERWSERGEDYLIVQSALKRGKKKRPRLSEEKVDIRERAGDMRDLGPDDYLTENVVMAGGRRLNCVVIHYHEDGEQTRQSYFSDQVPVFGLVRGVEIEGNKRTTVLRLEDFGFADGDETE